MSSANLPPMQNPITPTLPVQSSRRGEFAADGVDVLELAPLLGLQRLERRHEAAAHPAAAVEIRGDREVARRGEPARVLADVVVEAERLVQDDDAGPRPVADRGR